MPLGKPHIINLTTYQIYEEKYYMGNSTVVVSTLQQQSEFWTQGVEDDEAWGASIQAIYSKVSHQDSFFGSLTVEVLAIKPWHLSYFISNQCLQASALNWAPLPRTIISPVLYLSALRRRIRCRHHSLLCASLYLFYLSPKSNFSTLPTRMFLYACFTHPPLDRENPLSCVLINGSQINSKITGSDATHVVCSYKGHEKILLTLPNRDFFELAV